MTPHGQQLTNWEITIKANMLLSTRKTEKIELFNHPNGYIHKMLQDNARPLVVRMTRSEVGPVVPHPPYFGGGGGCWDFK